jgi:hypothetical protein
MIIQLSTHQRIKSAIAMTAQTVPMMVEGGMAVIVEV